MTRKEQIEAARPKDLNFRCDDVHCCAAKVWGEACEWADANPDHEWACIDLKTGKLESMLAIAIEFINDACVCTTKEIQCTACDAIAKIEEMKR